MSMTRGTQRKGKSARPVYVADFETTTDPEDCRVWAWGLTTVDNPEADFEYSTKLEEFIERISEKNCVCYFHNLKFDISFIFDWLLNNGFTHVYTQNAIGKGCFKTLISDMGKVYSVTVRWENGKQTEFRDSYKKIPHPVSVIAEAWDMPFTKGEIDYDAYRAPNHEPTPDEVDYLKRDVVIVATALGQTITNGMKKLTVASDALAEYKRLTGIPSFERLFPVLSESMDAEIRRAYRGGFTYADERFKSRLLQQQGLVLDVNSLYPSVMKGYALPYGEPEYVAGEVLPTAMRPLTIFSLTFTAKLKPGHIPCIQIKGTSLFTPTEYLTDIPEPTTLMMTNVDLALYQEHYDIDILEYGGGWRFHAAQGMFDAYIDKWARIKEHSTGGIREIAKLHLNSLYGKFASNPNVTSKFPVLKDGLVRYERGPDETRPPIYTAAGVFITSYARDITIRAAQANYDVFAYADTDSLHLLTNVIPENIDIHPTRMGAWKFEYAFNASFYIRAKAYLERTDYDLTVSLGIPPEKAAPHNTYVNRIAGYPEHLSAALTFDDLQPDRVLYGKLTPTTVRGGVVLQEIPYKLKL